MLFDSIDLHDLINSFGGNDLDSPQEFIDFKTSYGFEVVL
jgi:hypothetical protein